ncbi:MAG TPA: aspartate--tRNA ligase [Terriglobales bacterium]|nr:aspartate--tRNA ligase [Terriglobales bacterium]
MQLDYLGELRRTHTCGALRGSDAGKTVTLMGWVNRRRNLGNLIFIDLRDRAGITQVVVRSDQKELFAKAGELGNEYVVAVTGEVRARENVNDKIPTGQVEVIASELRLLNEAKTPPFSPADAVLPNEDTRLKYRYLDLRRPELQANVELRHRVALAIRNHLSGQGFFEIETPFLTRSTPEGARDFLVPSRVHHGSFYALPQSPQLFKQILMISGCDKYFQIVRCFRDEDLRADRQLEFTQIDLEMTYPQQERVFEVVEGFVGAAWQAAGVTLKTPFPRMTYDEAMRQYGSDKPDMRLPAMTDVKDAFAPADLEKLGIAPALPVVAIRIPHVGELSRKERDEIKPLFAAGKPGGAKLFDDWKRLEKNFPEMAAKIKEKTKAEGDDLVVVVTGDAQATSPKEGKQQDHAIYHAAGLLRVALGQKYAEKHQRFATDRKSPDAYRFLWVTDFPMFEWDEEEKRWNAAHHPFTSPHERDMQKVLDQKDLGTVRANAYDIVLNGTELGSGSIRIHRQDVQRQIFRALGMSEEEAKQRFGFFLEALEYGTPPHGGIALGLDRIVMILAGGESLREVIPFPKTAKAVDLMVDAPTEVAERQLKELGITVKK